MEDDAPIDIIAKCEAGDVADLAERFDELVEKGNAEQASPIETLEMHYIMEGLVRAGILAAYEASVTDHPTI